MRGVDAPAIAEHAVAMMLALAHGLDVFAVDTSKEVWSREHAASVRVQMMTGKTLLVSGLGGIGTEIAQRAHGLGMKVIATRQGDGPTYPFVEHIGQPGELLTLARRADVIISAVPLTRETTGLYDAKFFAVLKPNALFLNIARGPSVVTADLMNALNEKRIAGAGLDVSDPEPLPPGHPLWKSPRLLTTPHISGRSDLPGDDRWTLLAENFRRYIAGGRMLQVVDVQRGY
jgi:phosphoglycerate dehydrogenase-like enzyme